jgi:hypothetical protein
VVRLPAEVVVGNDMLQSMHGLFQFGRQVATTLGLVSSGESLAPTLVDADDDGVLGYTSTPWRHR